MYSKLVVLSLSAWLFLSIFIDMFVIPGAFKIIGDVFKAGTLGIAVFSSLNKFEVFFGVALVFGIVRGRKEGFKWHMLQDILAKALTTLAVVYYYYLAPKITTLTEKLVSFKGNAKEAAYIAINTDHQFFHNLYVKLDVVKIIILLFLLVLQFMPVKKKQTGIEL